MPRRRGETAPPAPLPAESPTPAPKPAVASLSLKVTELQARVADLEARLSATEQERQALVHLRQEDTATINRQDAQLRQLRKKVRTSTAAPAEPIAPTFADREQGFRHQVVTAWARRTPPAEQPHRPLPDFVIGPGFIASIDALEGVTEAKIADVVFEVLTGRADHLASRELHHLRTGKGGDDPQITRADGAACWRVSLQRNTASARRLHYWRLRDQTVELSRVVLHDDMAP